MADLTTTLSESVTLNGAVRGTTNTVTTTGINNVYERIVTCTTGQTTHIATFDTNSYGSAVQKRLKEAVICFHGICVTCSGHLRYDGSAEVEISFIRPKDCVRCSRCDLLEQCLLAYAGICCKCAHCQA